MKFCKDYDINMSVASAFEKNVHSMRVQHHAQKVVCIYSSPNSKRWYMCSSCSMEYKSGWSMCHIIFKQEYVTLHNTRHV